MVQSYYITYLRMYRVCCVYCMYCIYIRTTCILCSVSSGVHTYVHTSYVRTVYLEILVTFLIWGFGVQDQNCQISITKFT